MIQRLLGMISWLIALPFILLIKVYQLLISPILPSRCRFIPTCSHYALQAFKTYHPIKALYLSIKRIVKCHPWGGFGHDPLP